VPENARNSSTASRNITKGTPTTAREIPQFSDQSLIPFDAASVMSVTFGPGAMLKNTWRFGAGEELVRARAEPTTS
jgi:hypothetical protein